MRQNRHSVLKVAIGALAALWAVDAAMAKDDYGLKNPNWTLTPEAAALLLRNWLTEEWG